MATVPYGKTFRSATLKSWRSLRKLSGGPWLSKTGICSRQDAKNASRKLSFRPLRQAQGKLREKSFLVPSG